MPEMLVRRLTILGETLGDGRAMDFGFS